MILEIAVWWNAFRISSSLKIQSAGNSLVFLALSPHSQFLCTAMLGVSTFAIHKLALSAWKMHSCLFSPLPGLRSSPWGLIPALPWAVQLWAEQMLVPGTVQRGLVLTAATASALLFHLPTPCPKAVSSPLGLPRALPHSAVPMAAGWCTPGASLECPGSEPQLLLAPVWHHALGNIALGLKF